VSLCPIKDDCGGCPNMDESLENQRARHVERTERMLGIPVSGMTHSGQDLGFRARIELTPGPTGRLGYRAPRSHTPVPIRHCPVARPEINDVLDRIGTVPAFVERVAFRSDGSRVVVHVKTRDRHKPKAARWIAELEDLEVPIALNGRGVRGDATTRLSVAGVEHWLSPATFYQVNLEVNERLVSDVINIVEDAKPNAILDLFSGAGNLSMPLAVRGHRVTMMEAHPTATRDGRKTAERLKLSVDIRTVKAESYQAGDAFFDVAIIDPPRKGAGSVIEQVLLTRPRCVVMVSCNPRALAADLKRARKCGYTMPSVHLYEMFPHSDHVEAMGVLSSK
jgi:23S rRNA (uracil1939-C5)-methyltransferase